MTREEAIEVLKKTVDNSVEMTMREWEEFDKLMVEAVELAIEALSADAVKGWIPLLYDDNGLGTNFPHERDGEWVIVTDGKTISVERIKKDAYDHFFPNGRWFELEDVIAWMPLPQPYKGGDTE